MVLLCCGSIKNDVFDIQVWPVHTAHLVVQPINPHWTVGQILVHSLRTKEPYRVLAIS